MKLSEDKIKAKVLSELRARSIISKKSVIANEYRVGSSSLRADLAILESHFIGVEIKSELDSLRRLASQVQSYLAYFDRVIVVLASRHLKKLNWNILIGAEIWEIDAGGKFTTLFCPIADDKKEKKPLTDLMTQQERRRFRDKTNETQTLFSPPTEQISEKRKFAMAFNHRFEQTSRNFWHTVGRREIREEDLTCLSRLHDWRLERRKWSEQQMTVWQDWQQQAELMFLRPTSQLTSPSILHLCHMQPPDYQNKADDADGCLSELR